MSEWTPLAWGTSRWVRKYSEPPDFPWSVDAVHLISQDNNLTTWTRQFGTATALPNSSTTIHVYDDPAVFCQARPMAIGLTLPIAEQYGMGGYGGAIIPTVGELTIKVCNTPERNSGVYAKLTQRIIGAFALPTTEEGDYTVYQSRRSSGTYSGLPANLPLEEFWPLLDSRRFVFMYGPGYAMYVTQAIELEYGIIGSSPIRKVSLELMTATPAGEQSREGFYEPTLEVGVYNPPGSSSPIGFVGDPEQPFRLCASFPVPLNYKASGDIIPRSYASLTISSGSETWTSPTITAYRGDSFRGTVNVNPIRLSTSSIYRRSVEFDQGQAMRGSGGCKWCRRVGSFSFGVNGRKGAGNQAPKTKMVAIGAPLTDQHRKQFTEGAFGFPLTQSQNHWPSIASNYTQGAKVKLINAYASMRTSGVLIWDKEFQLNATNQHGVDLYPNAAYGMENDLDETVHITPSDQKLHEKPPAAIINPPGSTNRKIPIILAINLSDVDRFIQGMNQAIDDKQDIFEWPGDGYWYIAQGGNRGRVPIVVYTVNQYTIQRVSAQSFLTLSLTNEYRSERVQFSGTEGDATKATSGGLAANRQGVPVVLDVFDGKLVAKFSANLLGRKNLTKKARWAPSGFVTDEPFEFFGRQVTTIYYTDTRMVEVTDFNEPYSAFHQDISVTATLTDAQLQQLTSAGTTTIGLSAASGNTISGSFWNEDPFDYTIPVNNYPLGESQLQITLD